VRIGASQTEHAFDHLPELFTFGPVENMLTQWSAFLQSEHAGGCGVMKDNGAIFVGDQDSISHLIDFVSLVILVYLIDLVYKVFNETNEIN